MCTLYILYKLTELARHPPATKTEHAEKYKKKYKKVELKR